MLAAKQTMDEAMERPETTDLDVYLRHQPSAKRIKAERTGLPSRIRERYSHDGQKGEQLRRRDGELFNDG